MKEAANRGGLRSELAFHFAFFHTFTGVIAPSGVWTLLAVVVMVPSLNVTVCSRKRECIIRSAVRIMSYRKYGRSSDNILITLVKYTPLKKAASNKYTMTMQVHRAMAGLSI
jgi:hypothetical protein